MAAAKGQAAAAVEVGKDGLEIQAFSTLAAWTKWLQRSHATSPGLWVKCAKKGVTGAIGYATALDGALCWGWIDSQKASYDESHFVQRFTPRKPKSPWSKINREHVARLLEADAIEAPGLAEIERAKADGRWDAAYDGARTATVPEDLAAALAKNAAAQRAFETIDRTNRYAILYRVQAAKKPATRAAKIDSLVAMLARGELVHPARKRTV